MKTYLLITIFATGFMLTACGQTNTTKKTTKRAMNTPNNNDTTKVEKTEEEWRKILTPEQYEVLREKGTERPYSGKLEKVNDKG